MQLQAGDALGPYVVIGPAASGGMGEVYKASDTRLNRVVALKVIGSGLAEVAGIRSRFAAEARAVAALNHPHICALYDTGHALGRDYLVFEYLDGETLAQRLRRGAIPPAEVLGYAIEIAEALDYAHRQGIVHRDLKPSNVLLARAGGAKLLDFGVAALRATAYAGDGSGAYGRETAPLVASRPDEEEEIVGTLHYLAPERFDGQTADARSDVFAYGVMLFEMITNRKPFDEQNQARLIAAIISKETPAIDVTPGMPHEVQWVVQNCLAKEPDARWQSMGDVARVLKAVARDQNRAATPSQRTRSRMLKYTAALAGVIALTTAIMAVRLGGSKAATTVTLSVVPPSGSAFALTESTVKSAQFSVSPDGQSLVFVATTGGRRQLWLRELDQIEPRVLAGTAGASYPFWSPDSRSVGFFADGYLKSVGVGGRPLQPLCRATTGRGGAWTADGQIVFSPATSSPLFVVSASGGEPRPLTQLLAGHLDHRWPQALNDGRILFFVRSTTKSVQGTYVTSLNRSHEVRLVRPTDAAATAASGHLLFALDGDLVAQTLDKVMLQPSGEAVPVGLKVNTSSAMSSPVSASADGVLATWASGEELSELVWFDRRGARLAVAAERDRYVDFRLSPDERRVALARVHAATSTADLAILDLGRKFIATLTSSSQTDASPVWSPAGDRLVFRSNRRGAHELYETPATDGGKELLVHSAAPLGMYPSDWSADGNVILFHVLDDATRHDIWKLDLSRGVAEPLLRTKAEEAQGQLGPGGRLAYTSDASGTMQVFIRSLNGSDFPTNVSTEGGFDPRWRGDGRELYFISPQGMLMAAEVPADSLHASPARPLFPTPIQATKAPFLSDYVVTKDGSRFLMKVPTEPPGTAPITITTNWLDRLRATR